MDASQVEDGEPARRVGERIAEARSRSGLSRDAVGAALGLTGPAIGKWEDGNLPTAQKLARLCEVLNVSFDWLTEPLALATAGAGRAHDTIEVPAGFGSTWNELSDEDRAMVLGYAAARREAAKRGES